MLSLTNIPLMGTIGRNTAEEEVITTDPKSPIAESFRNIRSNLRYMTDYDKPCKVFMVSSFISGEGKTFCAKNLAYVFSITGKKTIYINTDLRKNNTYNELGVDKTTGLTEYLIGAVPLEGAVHRTRYDDLYVVPGGKLPPNPSELLMTDRFAAMLRYLQQHFDYIIMDTPPRGVLSDANELIKYTDAELFVVRQGFTIKQNVANLGRLYAYSKDKHPVGILFNGVDFNKMEYRASYKHSYGYHYVG